PIVRQLRMNQVREERQAQARLDLVSVLAGVVEDAGVQVGGHAIPVAHAQEDLRVMVELARQRLQLVAAVAVQQDELVDALALERLDEVGQDVQERGGGDAARQAAFDLQVVGVDAEGHGGQQHHLCAGLPSAGTGATADLLDLKVVGAVGHVQV